MSAPTSSISEHPHSPPNLRRRGVSVQDARAAIILLHGRGGGADGMLRLADDVSLPSIAYIAPQAHQRTWYPHSFLTPLADNEPYLSSALQIIDEIVEELQNEGLPSRQIVLAGFSQGACLSLEYAARHPSRYGGVVAFSGGLIGPENVSFEYGGSLDDTPVFLGCSDRDPHIPLERVQESTRVFETLGADVTERIYPEMGHTVNEDELSFLRDLLQELVE